MANETSKLNDEMDSDHGLGGDVLQSPLAVLSRTEIDQQIATAKRYPRSITRSKQRMIEMATADEETARSCFYTLKRRDAEGRDTFIEGPSVRLAEIAVNAWGNIRAGARIIGEENGFIVAQGVCHDMEANTWTSIEVRRRITKRNGSRFSDDMIGVTANAACAIAYRNAVHKIVPKAYIQPAYEAACALVSGDIKSLAQRRQNAVNAFAKLFITIDQLMEFLGKVGGIDDIDGQDLVRLAGAMNAIQDGDGKIDELFPKIGARTTQTQGGEAADLNATLDADKRKPQAQTTQQPAPAQTEKTSTPAQPKQETTKPAPAKEQETKPVAEKEQKEQAPLLTPTPPASTSTNPMREAREQIEKEKTTSAATTTAQGASGQTKWPAALPDSARKSKTFIDDAILELRGDKTNHAAKKLFHGADVTSWEKLAPARQDEKYVGLLNGDWDAITKKPAPTNPMPD